VGTTELVTVLFTDLVGSTDALARLGEDAAEQLRQAHFSILREAISPTSGREVKNLGDGLMVVFASASDAVACAVAMQQGLEHHNRRVGEPLSVRIGVAVGEATCEESDYFGTPVVEAARLCAKAEGGRILATDMVRMLAGSRGGQRFESLGAVQLKGLPDPIPVCQVLWEPRLDAGLSLPPRLEADRVAFVGRSAEREVFDQAWKRAHTGTRQVVLVAGEPGVGKTRLATEAALAAHAGGATVLLGVCDEDLAVPYQPFVEALRHYVAVSADDELVEAATTRGGELVRLVPELRQRLPGLPPPEAADPDTERYLLFEAVAGFLAAASGARPIVLVLDDLHWATKPTLLLLRHVVRHASPMALLVIGTYRDSDLTRGHPLTELLADLRRESGVERLLLRGLSDAEVVTFMEALAGHELGSADLGFAHAVYAETDGSPFFMREILRHLIEARAVTQEDGRWGFRGDLTTLGIPESVREVIGRRLWRLGEDVNQLLSLAAVIGRDFDVAVLAAVAGVGQHAAIDTLAEAAGAGLVREVSGLPGRFTFVHALIRHTLYEEVGGARRMELHRAVAQALESLAGPQRDEYVAELAHHWMMATPALGVMAEDAARAAGYAQAAGRRAMASLAYEEAVGHFQGALRAVALTDDEGRRLDILIALGDAQRCAGEASYRETLLAASHLAGERGDAERAAQAALANHRGLFSRVGAVDAERVAALEAALDAVGPADSTVRARLLASLASELHFAGDTRRHELGREALVVARRLDDPATLAQVLGAVWFATWDPANLAERAQLAEELAALAPRVGDRTLEFQAGVALYLTGMHRGDVERADAGLAICVGVAEQLGQPLLLWRATYLQMGRAVAAGRFADAERLATETERLGEATAQADRLAYVHGPLGALRVLQGRPDEAVDLLRPAAGVQRRARLRLWPGVGAGRSGPPGRGQ
jgi:class 3 adenylate cyclase